MEHAGRFVEDETVKEQMKDSGLGTPATRAAMIERLLKVGYIVRKGKSLLPTEKGKNLIAVVPDALRSPKTTGKWEKGLSSIAKGNMTQQRFMESIYRYVQFLVEDAKQHKKDVVFAQEPYQGKNVRTKGLGKCPLCQKGSILENSKSYYCTQWKDGCQFSIWKNSLEQYGVTLTDAMIKKLLKNSKIEKLQMVLPQTDEICMADLILKIEKNGYLEWTNVTRIEKEQ